ncbi:hypothetical protein JTE90_009879 [Oedothorax gibbosus]|uniref:Uncharacterized protein n=1 Tax=Oedothorax gibbosus TaxID=931172 RepID=A0AAV6UWY4_9ARAC|nr:hypothetical protein JTE90_009879 [Oedothorax gibbosus]
MKGNCFLVEVCSMSLMAAGFAMMLLPKGFAYPTDEKFVGEYQSQAYALPNLQDMDIPHHNFIQKPKSCFHFYVSRNMSSLLSDATKMLQQVHDRHEREWILTFIYRIKSLAEHLRTHPESKNYDCLTTGEDEEESPRKNHLKNPQQELYFVDDMVHNKRSDSRQEDPQPNIQDNQDPQQSLSTSNVSPENDVTVPGTTAKPDQEKARSDIPETASGQSSKQAIQDHALPAATHSGENIVLSSTPNCEANRACEKAKIVEVTDGVSSKDGTTIGQNKDQLIQQVHGDEYEQVLEEDRRQQRLLKQRIRKALLEEMAPEIKKLRTVGGSEEDLINLWRQSEVETEEKSSETPHYHDFDYEEIGAAAGDLTSSDGFTTNDHTVAPSLGEMKSLKKQSNVEGSTKSYEPYDDSDVLVKQLFDVRFEQASTSKSVKNGNTGEVATSATVAL